MDVQERLDAYLDANDLEAVWFARPNSFVWLTGGGDNVVDRTTDTGVAAAGYDGSGVTVVVDNIEAPRLRDEEVGDDVSFETFRWYGCSLDDAVAAVSPSPAAADFEVPGMEAVEASPLRQPLTDGQVRTYQELAVDVADAVERVARETTPSDTELDVTAELRGALERRDVATPVVLVGGGERAQSYRHYTSQDHELGEYALLSVTAHRDGLFTSCSRTVAFDPPDWLEARTHDAMRVEATALAATQTVGLEGGTAGDVFTAIQDAYAALGWDGEWENHHQGGAAGYAGREWIATPTHDASVELPMAYSWNPTVQGAKSEDLHLVTEGAITPMTATGEWPTTEVTAIGYDLTLDRHAPLEL